jgi:hypothetical protein
VIIAGLAFLAGQKAHAGILGDVIDGTATDLIEFGRTYVLAPVSVAVIGYGAIRASYAASVGDNWITPLVKVICAAAVFAVLG